MSDELKQRLATLRELAPRLNRETDEAAKAVAAVEEFLCGLSLGVSVRVSFAKDTPTRLGDDLREHSEYYLAYGRADGVFRVTVMEVRVTREGPSHGDEVRDNFMVKDIPWSSAPRELKLRSVLELPALLDSIVDYAGRLAAGSAEASLAVSGVLAALRDDSRRAMS